VKQFCRFKIWPETECKTPAEYDLQHNSTPPTAQLVWEGGGEVRDKVEGQQYTSSVHKYCSFFHGGNSSQAGSEIPAMRECISSL